MALKGLIALRPQQTLHILQVKLLYTQGAVVQRQLIMVVDAVLVEPAVMAVVGPLGIPVVAAQGQVEPKIMDQAAQAVAAVAVAAVGMIVTEDALVIMPVAAEAVLESLGKVLMAPVDLIRLNLAAVAVAAAAVIAVQALLMEISRDAAVIMVAVVGLELGQLVVFAELLLLVEVVAVLVVKVLFA